MNAVNLVGRLVRDAVVLDWKGGVKASLFTVAVNETKTNSFGEAFQQAAFIPVCLVSDASKQPTYLTKGKMVKVVGKLDSFKRKEAKYSELRVKADSVALVVPKAR